MCVCKGFITCENLPVSKLDEQEKKIMLFFNHLHKTTGDKCCCLCITSSWNIWLNVSYLAETSCLKTIYNSQMNDEVVVFLLFKLQTDPLNVVYLSVCLEILDQLRSYHGRDDATRFWIKIIVAFAECFICALKSFQTRFVQSNLNC